MEFGPFYKGDTPITPLEFEVETGEDLDAFDSAEVVIVAPNGTRTAMYGVTFDDGVILAEWPTAYALDQAGIYLFETTLTGLDSSVRLSSITTVVQDSTTGWHTLDSARAAWGVGNMPDALLWSLLEVARITCESFAPERETIPENYRRAQLLQARHNQNAGVANPAGDYAGESSFAATAYPLTYQVKGLLRPAKGRPVVG